MEGKQQNQKAEASAEEVYRSQKWRATTPYHSSAPIQRTLCKLYIKATLYEGQLPDTLLGSLLALFYPVLTISLALSLHLCLHN